MKDKLNELSVNKGHPPGCVCHKCGITRANIRLLNDVFDKNKPGVRKK